MISNWYKCNNSNNNSNNKQVSRVKCSRLLMSNYKGLLIKIVMNLIKMILLKTKTFNNSIWNKI